MTYAVATVVGHVGGDPEIRQAGRADVIQFSLAVNRKRGNEDFTDWYRCLCWQEGLIKVIDDYVRKGQRVSVTGELAQQKWESRDGEKTTMEINIYKLDLGDAPSGSGGARRDDRRDDRSRDAPRGGDRDRDDRDRGRGGRDDRDRGRDTRPAARDERDRGRGADDRDRGRGADDRGRGRGDDDRDRRPAAGARAADDRGSSTSRNNVEDDEIPF